MRRALAQVSHEHREVLVLARLQHLNHQEIARLLDCSVGAVKVRGVLGWAVARGYHLLQLPFASRRARVLADWTAAAVFSRD